MSVKLFLAKTGPGLARTSRNASGVWAVEALLTAQDVRCLVANPLNANVLDARVPGYGAQRFHSPLGWVDSW